MVKAKRTEAGYELSYGGMVAVAVKRPDLYFDLSLGGEEPVKGYLKDHKARFQAWVDGSPGGGSPSSPAPSVEEPPAAPPPPAAAPPAPEPAPAFEEPRKRDFATIDRERPPESEPGVIINVNGWDSNQYVRALGAKAQGGLITLSFESYTGRSVKVTMSPQAAVRYLERIEKMIEVALKE